MKTDIRIFSYPTENALIFGSIFFVKYIPPASSDGPIIQRTVGRRMRPWKRPKMQIMKKILKKDVATWLLAVTRRDIASSVEKPPLRTAGAMFSIMYSTFFSFEP